MSFVSIKLDIGPGGENYFRILDDKEFWISFIEKYVHCITYGTDSYNFMVGEYDYIGRKYTGIGLKEMNFKGKIFASLIYALWKLQS